MEQYLEMSQAQGMGCDGGPKAKDSPPTSGLRSYSSARNPSLFSRIGPSAAVASTRPTPAQGARITRASYAVPGGQSPYTLSLARKREDPVARPISLLSRLRNSEAEQEPSQAEGSRKKRKVNDSPSQSQPGPSSRSNLARPPPVQASAAGPVSPGLTPLDAKVAQLNEDQLDEAASEQTLYECWQKKKREAEVAETAYRESSRRVANIRRESDKVMKLVLERSKLAQRIKEIDQLEEV